MELEHFSHSHPLNQSEMHQEGEIYCSGCELPISGSLYGCNPCNFFLHESCTKTPRQIQHPAHPEHPLTLLAVPTYDGGFFRCDACGDAGGAFSFNCSICQFDLHVQCSSLPHTVAHQAHTHVLNLTFGIPDDEMEGTRFFCDVCYSTVYRQYWFYYCAGCDFGTHLDCATTEDRPESDHADDQSELVPNHADDQPEQESGHADDRSEHDSDHDDDQPNHESDPDDDQAEHESDHADDQSELESLMLQNCVLSNQLMIMRNQQRLNEMRRQQLKAYNWF